MAKLRHVAIQCDNPDATAKFYCDVFEMKELYRIGLEGDGEGAIYLSDGTVNLALIRITRPDFPNYRPKGLNHIGFVVEDLGAAVARAEAHGAATVRTGHEIREELVQQIARRLVPHEEKGVRLGIHLPADVLGHDPQVMVRIDDRQVRCWRRRARRPRRGLRR